MCDQEESGSENEGEYLFSLSSFGGTNTLSLFPNTK
jgi:hypothetical protein